MKKIKDLMKEKQSYIVEVKLNEKYHLFIEALTINGEAFHTEQFDFNNLINNELLVEFVYEGEGEPLYLDKWFYNLNTPIEDFEKLGKRCICIIENRGEL